MARTHARTKGKSGSSRPVNGSVDFVSMKAKDIEALIVKMAKEDDKKSSVIGLILRDTYGIPSVKKITGKSICDILVEGGIIKQIPEDLDSLVVKAKALKKHLEKNTRDVHNKRGFLLIESKIRRLSKYYKRVGKLESTWRYN